MPDCQNRLFEPSEVTDSEIYVGQECHVVARNDDPRVARSPSNLSEEEKVKWAHLIEDRHAIDNLVLMCLTHARLIDAVSAGYSVEAVVEIKKAHEEAVAAEDERRRSERYDDMPTTSAAGARVLLIDDVHEWERTSLRELAKHSVQEFDWLINAIGSPSDGDRCEAMIAHAPEELVTGSLQLRESGCARRGA